MSSPETRIDQLAEQLEWDTSFFGISIARVKVPHLEANDWPLLLDWCRRQGIRCLYHEIASDDLSARRLAEDHGCRLADVRIILEHLAPDRVARKRHPLDIIVRTALPEDLSILETIARQTAVVSRFYLDPGFPRGSAAEMYARWVHVAYEREPSALLVAELAGDVAGFLVCKRCAAWGQIDLMGVRKTAQGRGIGRALVADALRWTAAQGLPAMRVVTQAHNIPGQRLYQGMSFRVVLVTLLYHRWFERS